jgi:Uma2 family endonuclease
MGTRTLETFEQFEQFHDDGMKHELLEGEHIVLPPPKLRHARIQHKLLHHLWAYVQKHQLGDVQMEVAFRLTTNSCLQPDVSFVRTAQIQTADPDAYYQGAPAIAIEVASDSNTITQLDVKMELYFAHGSEEVWVVYPKTRRIRVHAPDGTSRTVASGEMRSDVLPGWSIAVDSIFED